MEEQDEVGRVTCGTQLTTPGTRLVERAGEATGFEILRHIYRLQPDCWELDDWHSWITVFYTASAEVPLGALQVEAVDVDAIRWRFLNLVSKDVLDVRTELKGIDRCLSLSRIALQGSSHEALREEEGWHPERGWSSLVEPLGEELHSRYQVWDPGAQWLQRGVANGLPLGWHLVVEEPACHALELHRHHYGSLDSLVELVKAGLHHLEKHIESVNFLANKDA